MTDILTLGNLLRLARDTVSNPREGANTVLSFAPERQALWLMFVLVIVLSLLLREFVAVFAGFPMDGPITGPMQGSTLALGLVMAGFLYLTMHAVHRIGQFFGGTGSFEETALLVIWLQFILICLQVIQIATLFILPPVAGLITIVAIALYVWLLVNFIAVLHGFTSLGMVFVATLLSGFALLFAFSLVLTLLGLGVAPPA
ncbi:MAG: Yip1 domain membrane protein [Rhodobacteraceae bacterium HLUCCO18]|nr:MAG: Yip1 domain membrane protein [Rhodobacteraceae bacterium HLUCCO18]